MNTGLAYDDVYLNHILDSGHPESPERLVQIKKRLKDSGLWNNLKQVSPIKEEEAHILKVHSPGHLKSVNALTKTGSIARRAVAQSLGAVKEVCEGRLKNAFCALRPPGHHSHNNGGNYDGSGQGEGFCFYNNIAIAAHYARAQFGYQRILIIDWDYHHGNGTEWAFYDDPGVLFFSTHEWLAYPGTGDPSRKGEGKGLGYNINVPLNRGAGDEDITRAFEDILLPAAQKYKPELVMVSAGFDSREQDPLGSFQITDKCFAVLTRMVMSIAATHSKNRLVTFLEGGYNVIGLAKAVEAHVSALSGLL